MSQSKQPTSKREWRDGKSAASAKKPTDKKRTGAKRLDEKRVDQKRSDQRQSLQNRAQGKRPIDRPSEKSA